ncbi:MAG: SMP-30/gluconolactonase/LRE family protein [Bryobacterales bacterium]|nr:SMP-30/gluconolactonase/LRE family protein [Bryobacterales bacterium]
MISPQGKHLGTIPVPENPANCAFGGKDGRTLFITARTSLYSVTLKTSGNLQ